MLYFFYFHSSPSVFVFFYFIYFYYFFTRFILFDKFLWHIFFFNFYIFFFLLFNVFFFIFFFLLLFLSIVFCIILKLKLLLVFDICFNKLSELNFALAIETKKTEKMCLLPTTDFLWGREYKYISVCFSVYIFLLSFSLKFKVCLKNWNSVYKLI